MGALNDLVAEASLGHKTKFKSWSSSESRKAMQGQMKRHRSRAGGVRDSHSSFSCWCPTRSLGRLVDSGSHWGSWRQNSSTFFSHAAGTVSATAGCLLLSGLGSAVLCLPGSLAAAPGQRPPALFVLLMMNHPKTWLSCFLRHGLPRLTCLEEERR